MSVGVQIVIGMSLLSVDRMSLLVIRSVTRLHHDARGRRVQDAVSVHVMAGRLTGSCGAVGVVKNLAVDKVDARRHDIDCVVMET